jgi:hypothetical protein
MRHLHNFSYREDAPITREEHDISWLNPFPSRNVGIVFTSFYSSCRNGVIECVWLHTQTILRVEILHDRRE